MPEQAFLVKTIKKGKASGILVQFLCPSCYEEEWRTAKKDFPIVEELNRKHAIHEKMLFGRVCDSCHSPLAEWSQCVYCGEIFWDGRDPHFCDELQNAMKYNKKYKDTDNWTVESWKYSPILDYDDRAFSV